MSADHVCWPDHAWQGTVTVTENVQLARDTYRIRFTAPELAGRIVPGQFLMLRLTSGDDPLLARPFALYDTLLDHCQPHAVDVVYLVVGKMTRRLAQLQPGQTLHVYGPLGNGFVPRSVKHLVMVAGGIGQTPFLALAREALQKQKYGEPLRFAPEVSQITFCYGARSKDYLAGVPDFEQLGINVRISTDDGSAGHHGRVTDLLRDIITREPAADLHVVTCGPEPMLAAVADLTAKAGVSCEVSLETPMACGLGICFSCVAKIRTEGDEWDYRRTCVEGPVFDARTVVF